MGEFHIEDQDNTRTLTIMGSLTIQDASHLRDLLLEAFSDAKDLFIDLSYTELIDLACQQILCSAHKTFYKSGKAISILNTVPAGITKSLADAAIEFEVCDREPHGPCLWPAGGRHE